MSGWRGEVLAMRLARAAGINAAEARLVESDGVPVALIKRQRERLGGVLSFSSETLR